ncbi:carbon-nitrogen hydrolase [Mycena floridula]|nr:carbon-nitrogen hydrolase [Mycena floridula]
MPITLLQILTPKSSKLQSEPVWLDLQGGVDKAISVIKEAAKVIIIGFPEVFVPGYPRTPWAQNFVMERICKTVKEANINVVLGFSKRDGGSLHMSQVTIASNGKFSTIARKYDLSLQPTHYEKIIFADGTQSIYNVVQTDFGRIGSLNCWEHIQVLMITLKAMTQDSLLLSVSSILIGSWLLAFPPLTGGSPYIVSAESCSRMTQMVSMEGGCFGLACSQIKMKLTGFPWFVFPGGGFATIYGPDGAQLTKSVDPGVETVVYADISLDK